jgi:isoleucyl-tRNA synthetase
MKTPVWSKTTTETTILMTAMFAVWMALKSGSGSSNSRWMVQSFALSPSLQRRVSSSALSAAKKGGDEKKKPQNPFASTIILPETGFSQRANAVVREPEIQQFWNEYDLYHKLSEAAASADSPRFVLHDGPPYANGDLHCGHALNKILKDFINRKQALSGKQVHYVPGWDCHGLPIELKVLQNMSSKERQGLTPVTLREKAASFAKETVQKQSQAFQRYGIFGDFEHPYLTLDPKFEAAQIRVFGEMFQKGFIFRGRKPVHWSPSSRTALAEAELEYPDNHVSKSIYVAFEVVEPSDAIKDYHSKDSPVKVAVWTTTPWTMPANLAVAVNPELSYSVVTHAKTGKLVVATDLMETIAVSCRSSRRLKNIVYIMPFSLLPCYSTSEKIGATPGRIL